MQLRQQDIPFGAFRTLLALGHTRFQQSDVVSAEVLYRAGLTAERARQCSIGSRQSPVIGDCTQGAISAQSALRWCYTIAYQ